MLTALPITTTTALLPPAHALIPTQTTRTQLNSSTLLPPPRAWAGIAPTPLQVLSKRLAYLASVGLLQQQEPEASQLMVTAAQPLPDELLTIVQV